LGWRCRALSIYEMDLVLVHAKYDPNTGRAYVEFRGPDDDGGDAIVTAIFSYKNAERLSKARVHEEIERKARHLLKRAAVAT
jgi:hypothetical protein